MTAAVIAACISAAVALTAALAALYGVRSTVRQKELSDRRAEWWRRATWALDKTASGTEYDQLIGWQVLRCLLASELATPTESAIIEALADVVALADNEDDEQEVTDDRTVNE